MKKIVFVSGQGETTWGYGFYQKKVILDKSQCCGGLVLDWVPLTGMYDPYDDVKNSPLGDPDVIIFVEPIGTI